ncbi:unnamed protein product [Ilex paraguariensis]|uniref:Uncharacterized protein n=1 Tax=Ilex paraguariensis TaxID=185542 RepID=A0ABC8UDW7_9AQUA
MLLIHCSSILKFQELEPPEAEESHSASTTPPTNQIIRPASPSPHHQREQSDHQTSARDQAQAVNSSPVQSTNRQSTPVQCSPLAATPRGLSL